MAEGQEGLIPTPSKVARRSQIASRRRIFRGRKMTPAERDEDLARQNPTFKTLLDRLN